MSSTVYADCVFDVETQGTTPRDAIRKYGMCEDIAAVREKRKAIQQYINIKLASRGHKAPGVSSDGFVDIAHDLLEHYRSTAHLHGNTLCPADQRLQNFVDAELSVCGNAVTTAPKLPARTFTLDTALMARELSLPLDRDSYTSAGGHVTTHRVRQGVVSNPGVDKRSTVGVFQVSEGGLPIPAGKIAVPKHVFGNLLHHALNPPRELLELPYTATQPEENKVHTWVSLYTRPIVVPGVPGVSPTKAMEVRYLAPASFVTNLDFVESIFGCAGDPYLPKNDAALDPATWTGTSGLIVLAPHLCSLTKKELGLPHVSDATEEQKASGMCYESDDELYHNGKPFKIDHRTADGVMVTILSNTYFGYSKKQVKCMCSFSANLFGISEEEHAGGALVASRWSWGDKFTLDTRVPITGNFSTHLKLMDGHCTELECGVARDTVFPEIVYVPEDTNIDINTMKVTFTHPRSGEAASVPLKMGEHYVLPGGYTVTLSRREAKGSSRSWYHLVGTHPTSLTYCHKPATPSGGGKALRAGTLVPTPVGLKKIDELTVGDLVYGSNGAPVAVTGTLINEERAIYRVTTDDGHSIEVDENHDWTVMIPSQENKNGEIAESFTVHSTKELYNRQVQQEYPGTPMIKVPGYDGSSVDLPVDPWLLGFWLGDGRARDGDICIGENGDREEIEGYALASGLGGSWRADGKTLGMHGLLVPLRELNVLKNKHIPEIYFNASRDQRLRLLQGLVDSEGHVSSDGKIEFSNTCKQLVFDVARLVHTLGRKASVCTGTAMLNGKDCGKEYRVHFFLKDAARLRRKAQFTRDDNNLYRALKFEQLADTDTTYCIEVANDDGLYLASPACLLTHNSEISKPITDYITAGFIFVNNLEKELDRVQEIIERESFADRTPPHLRTEYWPLSRKVLDPRRSLGSVIKLLTPSKVDYLPEFNDWLRTIPATTKAIIFILKAAHKAEKPDWRSRFSVDVIDGAPGHVLKLDNKAISCNFLRVGHESGADRVFKLRQDFEPCVKLQLEDDISASTIVPVASLADELVHEGLTSPSLLDKGTASVKICSNTEMTLFQRPDDACHPGVDAKTEDDFSKMDGRLFISNFEPQPVEEATKMAEDVVGLEQFTEPVRKMIRRICKATPEDAALESVCTTTDPRKPEAFACSARFRIMDKETGTTTTNPRYLQRRAEHECPLLRYLFEVVCREHYNIPVGLPVVQPVSVTLPGRRLNGPDYAANIRPLCVYGPLHYQELPELFADLIASITGRSPSTTGSANTEGALTKGAFNSVSPTADLNNALLGMILTGEPIMSSAAGFIGPNFKVGHDVSLLVPEVLARMVPSERSPAHLIENGFLEHVEDFEHDGKTVPASRLGYRITRRFVRHFLGRVFENPSEVFSDAHLRPETSDPAVFADAMELITDAQAKAARSIIEDGSVHIACPPLKALIYIVATGEYDGLTWTSPEFRKMFTREKVLASPWYHSRLASKQKQEIALWKKHAVYLAEQHAKFDALPDVDLAARIREAHKMLSYVSSAAYLKSLVGTIGLDPLAGF